jgi:hypothetical protein
MPTGFCLADLMFLVLFLKRTRLVCDGLMGKVGVMLRPKNDDSSLRSRAMGSGAVPSKQLG